MATIDKVNNLLLIILRCFFAPFRSILRSRCVARAAADASITFLFLCTSAASQAGSGEVKGGVGYCGKFGRVRSAPWDAPLPCLMRPCSHVRAPPQLGCFIWTMQCSLPRFLKSYKLGLTASLVVRLIGLWLVFASQKTVHNVATFAAGCVHTHALGSGVPRCSMHGFAHTAYMHAQSAQIIHACFCTNLDIYKLSSLVDRHK